MRIKKNKKVLNMRSFRRAAGAIISAMVLFPLAAPAAQWNYGTTVEVGVIHTNNVLLASSGLEESETVLTVAPQFFLTTDSERIDADIRYRPEAYFYSDLDGANDIFHVIDASLTGALIRDRFFVDLSTTNYQSIVTPAGRIPTSNVPVSGNRVDTNTFEVRPYWRQRLGQADLVLEAGYRNLDYNDSSFQSSNERTGGFRIDNIARQQGLAWGVDYEFRRVEYEISTPWEFQRAALDLGFWVNGGTRLFAIGGAETAIDNIFEGNMDAEFWELGFQYIPNQRMNLELAVGDRSYGSSFRGDFSYKLRRGQVALTYDEGPSNRSELGFDSRPISDSDNLDNYLDQPGASDRFLRRRGQLRATLDLSKSELSVRVFAERRENRTSAEGQLLSDEELAGLAVRWTWDFGTKTKLGIGGDISERDQTGFKDEILSAQASLTYQFAKTMSIRVEGIHTTQNGKDSGQSDYDENQARLLLKAEFR